MRRDNTSSEDGGSKRRSWYLSPFRLVFKGVGAAATGLGRLLRKGRNGFRKLNRRQRTPYASITTAFLGEQDDQDLAISARPRDFAITFPLLLNSEKESEQGSQALLTVGSKYWGNAAARGLLRIKVYDFALYANPTQVHQLCASQSWSSRSSARHPKQQLYETLTKAPGLEMSLVLTAARDLPVHLLASEYQRVLAARFEQAGGHSSDEALRSIIRCISQDRLPSHSLTGTTVKRGESLVFKRTASGHLQLHGGGQLLSTVYNPLLSEALFDLYLGTVPTSAHARDAAGRTVLHLLEDSGSRYKPQHGQRVLCAGIEADKCVVEV